MVVDKAVDWREKHQRNVDRYGGKLSRLFNFSRYDIGVYVFLLSKKWYTDECQYSKNGLTTELNSFPQFTVLEKFRIKYDAGKVGASLKKLVEHGFVVKCKNNPKKKAGHRNPDFIYESNDISVLDTKIKEEISATKKATLELIEEMGATEEDNMSYKKILEEKNNGK